jgi:hypothetical protein
LAAAASEQQASSRAGRSQQAGRRPQPKAGTRQCQIPAADTRQQQPAKAGTQKDIFFIFCSLDLIFYTQLIVQNLIIKDKLQIVQNAQKNIPHIFL